MDKLQAEMLNANAPPVIHVSACLLRFRSEYRVATTNIGHNSVCSAVHITQRYPMLLTRVATVFEARTLRQEPTKDTVFGVEHRQVVIRYHLYVV
jgi:hypothetical protein